MFRQLFLYKMIIPTKKYVITLDDPFYCEKGFQYNAIFGYTHIRKAEEVLGFQPKGTQTNWYVEITGDKTKEGSGVFVTGCRIAKWFPCDELKLNPLSNRITTLDKEGAVKDFYYNAIYVVE